jgi:DNA-binding transcriptional LysR family regulator
MWEYVEALILPPLLRRLIYAAPGMSITTSRVKRRDLETELASGSVDLAIDIPMTVNDRIRHKWLLNEPFVVMARRGHPAITDTLDLDTYLAQRHIQVSSRRHGPSLIDVELSRRGFRRHIFLRSQHNLTACMVVSMTDMLLTVPERHARLLNPSSVNADSLKADSSTSAPMNRVYPFPLQAPRLEAHLYWHESVENDPANRWLREEIEKVLNPEPQAEEETRKPGSKRRQADSRLKFRRGPASRGTGALVVTPK